MERERFVMARPQPALNGIATPAELLGWKPTHPGLIEDIEQGHYFS
jgi:hypothetical protein